MANEKQRGARTRLRVWATAKQTYTWVIAHRRELAAPLAVLIGVHVAVAAFQLWLLVSGAAGAMPRWLWHLIEYGAYLPVLVLEVAFLIAVQRALYRGEDRPASFFAFDRTLARSLLTVLSVTLLSYVTPSVVAVPAFVALLVIRPHRAILAISLLAILVVFAMVFVLMRLSLAVPAAALDERASVSVSWRATRGNVLRLLGACMLVYVPFVVVGSVLASSSMRQVAQLTAHPSALTVEMGPGSVVPWLLMSAIGTVGIVCAVVMFSLAYGALIRGTGPAAGPAAVQ